MTIEIPRGSSDDVIDQVISALESFQCDHPDAIIHLYRQNSVSVRVRILDSSFAPLSKVDRSKLVWNYLSRLPEEVQSDISTLLLLTPDEVSKSFANFEFDDPVPSTL